MNTISKKDIQKYEGKKKYNKCGHSIEATYDISTDEGYEVWYNDTQKGIADKCDKCKEFDKEYSLVNEVSFGDYESSGTVYVFNTSDVRKVIRYCYAKEIPLHDQSNHINSMYDCTGKCYGVDVMFRRGKKVITVTTTFKYDV